MLNLAGLVGGGTRTIGIDAADLDEPIRIGDAGPRPNQVGIGDAKDDGRSADANRQGQHSRDREHRAAPQRPQRQPDVTPDL